MREMKDSGVNVIGHIPCNWIVCQMKFSISIASGTALRNEDIKSSGKYAVFGGGEQIGYTEQYNANENCVLVGRVGSCGKVTYPKKKIWATDNALIVTTKQNVGFIAYALEGMNLSRLVSTTAQPLLTGGRIKKEYLSLPSIYEQAAIVSYLDSHCSAIDRTIKAMQDSIEKLKEYKTALITRVVTKGLNPNAEMKDSGMEWIGKMPAHWEFIRTKYLFKILKRIAGTTGYDILSITQQGIKVKDISKNEGQLSSDYSKYQLVYPGDFAMNHMDLLTGGVGISDKTGVTSPDYRVFRKSNPKVNNDYFLYVFQTLYNNKVYYGLAKGVAEVGRKRLQAPVFRDFKLPVPPLDEQAVIVSYLNNEFSAIDHLIVQKEKLINKVTEYRQSLIYHAVTGKIDCRGSKDND